MHNLILYSHPLASFCHKVLIALYEKDLAFTAKLVDLANDASAAEFLDVWPVGKMPVLRDENLKATIPETSVIIEYLDQNYPGVIRLIPNVPSQALEVRKWDRFFDLYVHAPMQKIVLNELRGADDKDEAGVREARETLHTAYGMAETLLRGKVWAMDHSFTMVDCAAAPALFYADIVEPFHQQYPLIAAYFERLLNRPSFARVLEEAKPYFANFPFVDKMPARFL